MVRLGDCPNVQKYREFWVIGALRSMPKKTLVEHANKSHLFPKILEDYEPGATQAEVLEALKKAAKSPKPPRKRSEAPVATS